MSYRGIARLEEQPCSPTNLERAYPVLSPRGKGNDSFAEERVGKIVPALKINRYRRRSDVGERGWMGGKEKRKRIKEERKEGERGKGLRCPRWV